MTAVRIGTRRSRLALAQANQVAELLRSSSCCEVELVEITTSGDRRTSLDKTRFVKEIELALLADEIEIAIHSAKDLPAEDTSGLEVAATVEREDPSDCYLGQAVKIEELGQSSQIGTSSLRRQSLLKASNSELKVEEMHGNIDTRIAALKAGKFGGIVLATAGINRLGLSSEIAFKLPVQEFVPAAGQGTLALQTKAGELEVKELVSGLNHEATFTALMAERTVVRRLEADCNTPLGVYARLNGELLQIESYLGLADGSSWLRDCFTTNSSDVEAAALEAADRLLSAGGKDILEAVKAS